MNWIIKLTGLLYVQPAINSLHLVLNGIPYIGNTRDSEKKGFGPPFLYSSSLSYGELSQISFFIIKRGIVPIFTEYFKGMLAFTRHISSSRELISNVLSE